MLANWFLTTNDFDSEQASPAVAASTLLPEQFTESADVLKYILESWYMYGLQLPEIQRDLLLLNCPRERIERLGSLLERLRPARDRVYRDYMRFDHENAVLPTLNDINVVCDLRPVFEDTVYPIPEALPVRHTKLLGYSYMVLTNGLHRGFWRKKAAARLSDERSATSGFSGGDPASQRTTRYTKGQH